IALCFFWQLERPLLLSMRTVFCYSVCFVLLDLPVLAARFRQAQFPRPPAPYIPVHSPFTTSVSFRPTLGRNSEYPANLLRLVTASVLPRRCSALSTVLRSPPCFPST